MRIALRRTTVMVAAILSSAALQAGTLASDTLLVPMAPEQNSSLSIPVPAEFAPDQEVWIAYELLALAADAEGDGEIDLEQAFEGVATPVSDLSVTFHADKMDSRQSAGTIAERLEQIAGRREPEEWRRLMGAEMFAAYEAVNSGEGRMLSGRLLRRLPAPGTADTRLLVSLERAAAMQPLAIKVTVGQGSLPAEFQEKTEDSAAYKFGYGLGLLLFGWLVMRLVRRRPGSTARNGRPS